jgi:hypothetical protein
VYSVWTIMSQEAFRLKKQCLEVGVQTYVFRKREDTCLIMSAPHTNKQHAPTGPNIFILSTGLSFTAVETKKLIERARTVTLCV